MIYETMIYDMAGMEAMSMTRSTEQTQPRAPAPANHHSLWMLPLVGVSTLSGLTIIPIMTLDTRNNYNRKR